TIGFDVVIAFVAIVRLVVHDPERILRIARRNAAFDRLDAAIARLRLLVAAFAILLREQTVTRHRRRHDAVIMLCVLQEVLVSHTVAARLGVARVLRVLLVNLSRGATDFDFRPVAFQRSVAVIVVVTATTTAAAGLAPAPPLTLHETIPDLQSIRPSWTELGSAIP